MSEVKNEGVFADSGFVKSIMKILKNPSQAPPTPLQFDEYATFFPSGEKVGSISSQSGVWVI